jgi:hypothetical protein
VLDKSRGDELALNAYGIYDPVPESTTATVRRMILKLPQNISMEAQPNWIEAFW